MITSLAGGLVKLSLDGDKYCALYGKDLQEGLAGFGKTEMEALSALFKALGQEGAARWQLSCEPEVHTGGAWMSLPKALLRYEIDRTEVAAVKQIEKMEIRVEKLENLGEPDPALIKRMAACMDCHDEQVEKREEAEAKLAGAQGALNTLRLEMQEHGFGCASSGWFTEIIRIALAEHTTPAADRLRDIVKAAEAETEAEDEFKQWMAGTVMEKEARDRLFDTRETRRKACDKEA